MKNLKIGLMLVIFGIAISGAFAVDGDYGTNFSFSPASGSLGKLYCDFPVSFIIDGSGNKYNGFAASIAFDSSGVELRTGLINSVFSRGIVNNINGNLYNIGGNIPGSIEPGEGYKQGVLTGVTFVLKTKENMNTTTLSLVGWNGLPPERFGLDTTDDGITLNGFVVEGKDILTSITDATYNFVALPCVADNKSPTIGNLVISGTLVSVNKQSKIGSNQALSFVTYDWDGSNSSKMTYWFSGNTVDDLKNYVSAPSNVDNQEGVDSSSISVIVSCPTCSSPKSNIPVTLLSISDWSGDGMNALTWDSERRGYNVSFDAPFPYEVEKEVFVEVSVSDNLNEFGQIHTGSRSFSFNASKAPEFRPISPSAKDYVSPSKDFPIVFEISDDWAGVDTGKVVISMTYSGEEFIYSGSDLSFVLTGGEAGLGNAGSYIVSFYPKEDFPVSTKITLNVTSMDLAGTTGTYKREFNTRPSCVFFGCVDSLDIIIGGVSNIFTGKSLSITGTNPDSPYPYLTGENYEILMCGKIWTGINFAGVSIYNVNGELLEGDVYTDHQLYITGLDFTYDNGVILIQ